MSDTAQDPKELDLDTLTDDQVMELGPDAVQALMEQEGQEDVSEETPNNEPGDDPDPSDKDDPDPSTQEPEGDADPQPSTEPGQEDNPTPEPGEPEEVKSEEPEGDDPSKKVPAEDSGKSPEGEAKGKEEPKKDSETPKADKEKPKPSEDTSAVDFMKKITAPFKADGRDMQVRTAEDAIRLMQMGVNYSRRMQEMKPLKAQDVMLRQHGLNDPEKLSYLIDLAQGKPDAIQKLLKEKGIDPLDIDTSKDPSYKTTNYSPDTKDLDFQEAIQNTLAAPQGQALINDVNAMWDDSSKEALRDQPQIFNNLLAQMDSGVYEKIKGELEYQRTLGHLTGVPFLQAYHEVGDAMQKAGVFDKPKDQSGGLAPLQAAKPEPIDTGVRKAADKPKTEQPNPNLSSTPRNAPSNGDVNDEKDYSSMSDEDFLKLGTPG